MVHLLYSVGHPCEGVAGVGEGVERVLAGSFHEHSIRTALYSKYVKCSPLLE